MTEELMVGTIGWDHENWAGGYYPDDLPDDWRFAYYSNDYRSVLVPADHLRPDNKDAIAQWTEDCDEAFRFVVEIPETCVVDAGVESLQVFLDEISSLHSRTGGYFLSLSGTTSQTATQLQPGIELLQEHGPVCIDFADEFDAPEQLMQLMADTNIGLCWHPDRDDAPAAGGGLMLVLSNEKDPRAQRRIIESLEQWMQQSNGVAGLFLQSAEAASQARIIAEMLGV